jgi:hypothetical protein
MLAPPLTIGSLLAHLPYALGKLARRLQRTQKSAPSRLVDGAPGCTEWNGEKRTEHDHLNQPSPSVKDRT